MKPVLAFLVVAVIAAGCGGGGQTSTTSSSKIRFTIQWPPDTRFIHQKADTVRLEQLGNDGSVIGSAVEVHKPATTYTMANLPSGYVRLRASALQASMPELILSKAIASATLRPGETTSVDLTLESTASSIEVTAVPQKDVYLSGDSVQLEVTARNASGSILLGQPTEFTYVSSNPSKVSVNSDGLVQVLAPGTATITVTEKGSGTPTITGSLVFSTSAPASFRAEFISQSNPYYAGGLSNNGEVFGGHFLGWNQNNAPKSEGWIWKDGVSTIVPQRTGDQYLYFTCSNGSLFGGEGLPNNGFMTQIYGLVWDRSTFSIVPKADGYAYNDPIAVNSHSEFIIIYDGIQSGSGLQSYHARWMQGGSPQRLQNGYSSNAINDSGVISGFQDLNGLRYPALFPSVSPQQIPLPPNTSEADIMFTSNSGDSLVSAHNVSAQVSAWIYSQGTYTLVQPPNGGRVIAMNGSKHLIAEVPRWDPAFTAYEYDTYINRDGTWRNLNDLIPDSFAYDIERPMKINENDQVLCYARPKGAHPNQGTYYVLLSPN